KTAIPRQRASKARSHFASLQPCAQGGQCSKPIFHAQVGVVGRQRDTNLISAYRSGIALAVLAPVHLHVVAPRLCAVVVPECTPPSRPRSRLQSRPAPHSRVETIRANDPARPNRLATKPDAFFADSSHRRAPS